MGKDKNAPKRSLSGYMLFCNNIRAKMQRANPEASMLDMAKLMGAKWGTMSDSQKKPFNAKAAKAKQAYNKKMDKYKQTAQYKEFQAKNNVGALVKKVCKQFGIDCKKRNPTKFVNDPNAPSRAASGFFLFGASVRPALLKKFKGQPVSVVAKAIGEQWKSISDAEKAKWNKKAQTGKKAVEAKRKKYQKTTSFKNYEAAKKEFNILRKKAMKA